MNIIDPEVRLLTCKDPLEKIERVGRTCYKSSSDFTRDTSEKFYKMLVSNHHAAMLEHATFLFECSNSYNNDELIHHYQAYKYLNFSIHKDSKGFVHCLVSGNLRAICETGEMSLLVALYKKDPLLALWAYQCFPVTDTRDLRREVRCKALNVQHPVTSARLIEDGIESYLPDVPEEVYKKHKFFTFKFTTDRGVSHECVRHRPFSLAQESTRYCNYSKDKFGNELTFVKPFFYKKGDIATLEWQEAMIDAENTYFSMLALGIPPEGARSILPNSLKTELVLTGNCEEWEHFFDLRSKGTTGKPHPDMEIIADKALSMYNTQLPLKFLYK